MSGLSHTPGKRARGYTLRGFESRLLRQYIGVYQGLIGFPESAHIFKQCLIYKS